MNWKLIGLAAVINAIITVFLTMIFLPISFIGPVIGGFFASYLSKGYEDYEDIDVKDGAVLGAVSGLIGGLILTSLLIWFGTINSILEVFITNNPIILGYAILQVTTVLSFIFGLVGGVIGVMIKK